MAQHASTPADTAKYVRTYKLPREALNPEHLNDRVVWEALLEMDMPLTALVRNLATMTRVGVLDSKEHLGVVLAALASEDAIRGARVHPLALLIALRTYAAGHGFRGQNTWAPKPSVIDALDGAFYLAFDNVEPSGKKHMLAIDVSASMDWPQSTIAGTMLKAREAAAAMALVTLHAEEDDVEICVFADMVRPLGLSRRQRLDDVVRAISDLPATRTDCALPMLYATRENRKIDSFVVYTDSETWFGTVHPKEALDQYRNLSGIPARSVVVGMVSNGFTIADPQDPGMLDCVGFDAATPGIISEFALGRV